MTAHDRARLILDAFAAAERTHPCLDPRELLEVAADRIAVEYGLCITPDEVARVLSQAAFSL